MGLIYQLIEKKMLYYQENLSRREYLKSFWQFYCAINLAESYLQINNDSDERKKVIKMRERVWRKWCDNNGRDNPKLLSVFHALIKQDMKIVMMATNKLQREDEEAEIAEGEGLFRSGDIAVIGFDFPQ